MAIDGHSVVYRAYFALAGAQLNLSLRATGEPTGAVFNFVNMFVKAWQDVDPDYWAIAFDTPKPRFRDAMYDAYKGGRAATPDELQSQFGRVRPAVESLDVLLPGGAGSAGVSAHRLGPIQRHRAQRSC